jgi:hypothetical protein
MKAVYRWVITGLMVVGMIAAIFSVRVPRAYACGCPTMEPSTSEEEYYRQEFERASAVFSAKALNTSGPVDEFASWTADFQILEVWKGPVVPVISVNNSVTSCGIDIEEGELFLVYAYTSSGSTELWIEACTLTTQLKYAELQLELLGVGTIVATQPAPTEMDTSTFPSTPVDQDAPSLPAFDPTIGVVLLAVIGLLVLALFIVMRRSGKA